MRIYFVRHGEPTTSFVNPERPLTQRGRHEIAKLVPHIKENNIKVSTIYHSGKSRARETAEILHNAFDDKVGLMQRSGIMPEDPVEPFVEYIGTLEEDTMFVGHLPFMEYLMGALFSKDEYLGHVFFRQGEFVTLEKNSSNSWHFVDSVAPEDL